MIKFKISVWYFIKQIKTQLLFIVLFAIGMGFLDLLPAFQKISLPLPIPAILGTAVSLLLAFRTSQSYERWWEARIIWGGIVNDSRNFIRQIVQYLPEDKHIEIQIFAERQIVWNFALGEALRKISFSPKVKAYLDSNKIESTNIPNSLLDEHSYQIKSLVKQGLISDYKQVQLNETLGRLCDNMGKCERIKNTNFPQAYSLLLHTLIYIFAAILPFGLDDSQLALEIGITILIPSIFIAIEKTAIIMQDPFENRPVDVQVTALAETIETNINQMINRIK